MQNYDQLNRTKAATAVSTAKPIRQQGADNNDKPPFDPLELVAAMPLDVVVPPEELVELPLVPFVAVDGKLVILIHEALVSAVVPGVYGR